ncbi:MAG TPA: SIMPL domain-containing protein, partial [Thermoanaerobaculia bacterium]|nr:SIMPL domain-containing protein [Thermoanaerobaculia bacterium]
IGRGLFAARASERVVTVKGLAEREVPANLAMWPIVFSTTGNDLVAVQATLDAGSKKIFAFLAARGFAPPDYTLSSPRVTDRDAQGGRMRGEAGDRYVAEQTVTLRSGKIAAVKEAMQRSGELIRGGVALVRSYEYSTTFLYTALDEIKPAMIAEATKDARKAAEQFARDSGSRRRDPQCATGLFRHLGPRPLLPGDQEDPRRDDGPVFPRGLSRVSGTRMWQVET